MTPPDPHVAKLRQTIVGNVLARVIGNVRRAPKEQHGG